MAYDKRREIERDLHDGVQQDLIALAVNLQLAEEIAGSDPAALARRIAELRQDVRDAIEAVRALARSVYPSLLADLGLAEALRGAAPGVGIPVGIEDTSARFGADIEATVYFCCLDALRAVAPLGPDGRATIRFWGDGESVRFEISVEGIPAPRVASALESVRIAMDDRVAAVGGTLTVAAALDGARVGGRIPHGRTQGR
jgi:signal transduction histidine kinase